ncbi:MAG: SEC-C metal-binding domain-containing protein [Eubacteriales bacterium]
MRSVARSFRGCNDLCACGSGVKYKKCCEEYKINVECEKCKYSLDYF